MRDARREKKATTPVYLFWLVCVCVYVPIATAVKLYRFLSGLRLVMYTPRMCALYAEMLLLLRGSPALSPLAPDAMSLSEQPSMEQVALM